MRELPIITIVVPSFNQATYLPEALESVLRQDYPRLELFVMDGGSTDGSLDIIRTYEHRLTSWQSRPDGGQAAAVNEGARRSSGDLVAWLNSDDFYWGNALWTVADTYRAHPECGLYVGNGFRLNQATGSLHPFCPHHVAFSRRVLREGLDYVLQPSTFFSRRAWQQVGGLREDLHYCMDWDVLLRIADHHPVAAINEFLAVSREYGDTKTSTGKLKRAVEICRMVRSHTGRELTPGALYYLLETLLDVTDGDYPAEIRHHLYAAMRAMAPVLTDAAGNGSWFPVSGDPQDHAYLPLAHPRNGGRPAPVSPSATLPSISIVTPSFNQAPYLGQTLDSVLNQSYPGLELIVMDGGSTDGSLDVLRAYQPRLTRWVSEPDRGPAHAINKGLALARGEIVAWLNSDDMLAEGALREVARRFQQDPSLDMVYANALYIDEDNRLFLADHGTHKTGLYYGSMRSLERVPAYWSYVHAVPQPTVFFRRRLLASCGFLDESYHFIFDFEFFFRLMGRAKIEKIERTQAFYRIHAASKTSDWSRFLIELYRFSRQRWPRRRTAAFRTTLTDFVASYMRRRFPAHRRDLRYWIAAGTVAVSALTKLGNPEAMQFRFMHRNSRPWKAAPPSQRGADDRKASPTPVPAIDRSQARYRSVFCSFLLPRHPGRSGGEIRDFHLLRRLLSISHVDFLALYDTAKGDERYDLQQYFDRCWTPRLLREAHPELVQPGALEAGAFRRLSDRMQAAHVPLPGFSYHRDVGVRFPMIRAYAERAIAQLVQTADPDFLIVSPQVNPLALALQPHACRARLVLASYDVESVRMRRMVQALPVAQRPGAWLEARRARRFERQNLALYDGVIAVSDLDKVIFEREFGVEPERVLVIENSVDTQYFAFAERAAGEHSPHALVVLVGNFGYLPNRQAALRLLRQIMPLVRRRRPEARAWIVGTGADRELTRVAGERDVVTGPVTDVRPYLARADVACMPLLAGSGTKYKVLEAMSAGVPVVCTPLAAEGLALDHMRHAVIEESNEALAAAVVRVLADREHGAALASSARALVEQRYSWDVNLDRLAPWLERIRKLPRRATLEANRVLERQLIEAEADRAARLQVIQALGPQLAEVDRDRQAGLQHMQQLEAERARLVGSLERLQSQFMTVEGELRAVYASRSWQLTAPLRALGRIVERFRTGT